jgi:hypothetical protein
LIGRRTRQRQAVAVHLERGRVRCSRANQNSCAGERTDSLSNTGSNHLDSSVGPRN